LLLHLWRVRYFLSIADGHINSYFQKPLDT
jgi:hypothetical protein